MRRYLELLAVAVVAALVATVLPPVVAQGDEVTAVYADITSTDADAIRVAGGIRVAGWDGMLSPFVGACPAGWSEHEALRGRTVFGLPDGGTNGGTIGVALADREVRRGGSAAGFVAGRLTYTNPTIVRNGSHGHMVVSVRTDSAGGVFADDSRPVTKYGVGMVVTSSAGSHSHAVSGGVLSYTSPSYMDQPVPAPAVQYRWCEYDSA